MTTTTGRHRIAARAAVIGAVALLGLIALPVLAADFDSTVRYTCGGTTYPMDVQLDGPDTNPTPSQVVTVSWLLAPTSIAPPEGQDPTESVFIAPVTISPSDAVVIEGKATIAGTPVGANPIATAPVATESAVALAAAGATMTPIPEMVLVFTPTATGTVGVTAGGFVLKIVPLGGQPSTHYSCEPANHASPATLALTVATSAADDPDDTTTTTTTATSTVFETETVQATDTETVTNTVDTTNTSTVSVTNTAQVGMTPVGGAQTGGGGDVGADARLVMLVGISLIGAATLGGLVLRHRTSRNTGT
ncbi:hypothetical protein Acor_26160 [Acrocarpospora corrugata]|uniref:Uncharacterized protein n=1 Tax=Acrocarpospora corrugata TaxID=35763 RepID=A0A5M3VXU4_9ACTN|nr:hypothetical protein [Acrocarpospora corrugata]GES00552.1 hypothetical protein Acor_26160 [Acrocarpospora corrugata]